MVIRDDLGQIATEHGNRTGHDETGVAAEMTQALQQQARRIEVHPHAKVEVGLCLAGDDGCEMEDATGLRTNEAFEYGGVGDVGCHALDFPITEVVGGNDIEKYQFICRRENAVTTDPALLQDGLS
jgi:hypothetical protein